jgi:predicted ATPase/DNA-binding SARP family transcriptional activator
LPPGVLPAPDVSAVIVPLSDPDQVVVDSATPVPAADVPTPAVAAPEPPATLDPPAAPPVLEPEPAASVAPGLRVRTLGSFAVWRGLHPLPTGRWSHGKTGALFKLLLGAAGHRLSREQLIDLLWPEADIEQGAANLRSTVRYLREALDVPGAPSYLQSSGALLVLDPAPGNTPDADWLDRIAFARRARTALAGTDRGACRAALALHGGEYLPEVQYEDWKEAWRRQLKAQHEQVLLHLATLAEREGDIEEALWALRTLLAADPCQEEAARALMGVLLAQGRQAEALRVYHGLVQALRDELDAGPAAETEALRARIQVPQAPQAPEPAVPTNLPAALTRFIGREAELVALEHALFQAQAGAAGGLQGPGARLLNLTGVGGTGKTRLALALGAAVLDAYPDGVWLVELAPLAATSSADPAPVAAAALTALSLREQRGSAPLDAVIGQLREKRLLLILDNCEHLVGACATFTGRLLAACPALQILATSREALGMAGEMLWPVAPLALPSLPDGVAPALLLARVARAEAVQLFLERARAARPGFVLDEVSVGAVIRICRQLEGLPLAIELAAARLQALAVEEIATRLDDRFHLLRRGNRAALPRHQTLQAAMDWSWDLLEEPERILLRRLAVFASGWTVEAAEAVCAWDDLDPADVLDLLTQLVAKSLVLAAPLTGEGDIADTGMRYGMLETVRQYAGQHLARAGDVAATRERHLTWCVTLAEQAEPHLGASPLQAAWVARLAREHDNVRAALTWSLAPERAVNDNALPGLQLAGALRRFWQIRGPLREGQQWFAQLLARPTPNVPDQLLIRLRALHGAHICTHFQTLYDQAIAYGTEAVALSRALGDRRWLAVVLHSLGFSYQEQGNFAVGRPLVEEALAVARELNDLYAMAMTLNTLGGGYYRQGEPLRAIPLLEEGAHIAREMGAIRQLASTMGNLGNAWQRAGDAVRSAQANGESLALYGRLGDRLGVAWCLEGLALLAAAAGRTREAARMLGAAAELRRVTGVPLEHNYRVSYDAGVAAVRAALGEEEMQREWRAGAALALSEMVALGATEAACAQGVAAYSGV